MRALGKASATVRLTFLRPASDAAKLSVTAEVPLATVQFGLQPVLALTVPVVLLASSTSTRTLPVKVVSTPVPAVLTATTATLKVVPETLVRMTPLVAPAAVLVSNALKRAGGVEGGVPLHSAGMAAPLPLVTQLVVHEPSAPQHTPPLARSAQSRRRLAEPVVRRHCEAWMLPRRRMLPPAVTEAASVAP